MSMKPNGKSIISSSDDNSDKKNGSNPLLSAAVKAKGKAHVSSDDNREVMFFNEISLGPQGADHEIKFELEAKGRNIYRRRDNLEKLKTQLASREKFYGKFLLSNLSTSKFQLECGVSVPDDKRLFKLVSMSGALEELLVLNKKILDIQLHELVSRHGAIVEKVRIQSPFQVIVHHSLHIIKFLPSFYGAPHI
ncbi:hypothetical protein YC2023_072911 [Brassica napus]